MSSSSTKFFFVFKDSIIDKDDDSLKIISLKNPATKNPTRYLLRQSGSKPVQCSLYEVNCFNEQHRSWFINESVCSNGKIYFPTPIDPLFLALPYLEAHCSEKAVPLDHIFVDEQYPFTSILGDVLQSSRLSLVADEKRAGQIVAYKHNESKVLAWLAAKCQRLSGLVGRQNSSAARSQNYIKEEKENELDHDERGSLQTAFGIVSDYLSLELSRKLSASLGFPEDENVSKKRKSAVDLESSVVKRIKKEEVHETTPIKQPAAEKKVSAKTKALAKAANGSKSISSFFKK